MTIHLRQMSCIFLQNGSDMLLMQRAMTRHISPGLWAGIGGHLDPDELSDPEHCVLRELQEETGILPQQVYGLRLRAVLHRLRVDEIRLQYLYVASTDVRDVIQTPEGVLYWVPIRDVLQKDMSAASRYFLERFLTEDAQSPHLWVGTMGNHHGAPTMQWADLVDWEVPE